MKGKALLFALVSLVITISASAQLLKLSDNHRYLVTQQGEPFFWMGDTGWEMLHRLDRGEMSYYMSNRAGKGFNVIQTVIVSEIDGLTFPNMEGNLPFRDFDPENPEEAYFELVDFAVKKAEELGLVLALLPTWHKYVLPGSHPLKNNKAVFDLRSAYRYGLFLGERYRESPNIVWILGGDWPAGPQKELWDEMARGLEEGDGGRHLMSYHPRGMQTSSTWLHQSAWLDFNMVQTGHSAPSLNVYDWIYNDYMLTPTKPVINGEPAYEEIGIFFNPVNGRFDHCEVRKQAYWSVFAGAFGHTYGNNNIWQINRDDSKGRIWPNKTWDKALEDPGSREMGYLRRLMESRPFLSRIPDQTILLGANPSYATDHIRVTRDGSPGENDASYIMVYMPYYKSIKVRTSVIASPKLKVWWFNPQTGEAFPQGLVENSGEFVVSNWTTRFKEGQGGPDWVVVIDAASVGYRAPGR